jgi:guanylate kinase
MSSKIVRRGILFVLIGPSGSGKSTFCARLVEEFPSKIKYSISATTRPPRENEVHGVSYHFMSREDFHERRERGEFFEWEENHGNLYGTLRSNISDGISSGTDLLFQIDIRGALNFKKSFPDNTVTIFIIPPSFEVLNQRLLARGTVDPEELKLRYNTAQSEYAALLSLRADLGKIDYVVVNQELASTYDEVRPIVLAEQARYHRMDISSVAALCAIGEGGA